MSSTHLPVNKLVSTEKPGWVAARAEGRGSVKAVSTRGKGDRGKLRPRCLSSNLPDREGSSCQLPTSLHYLYTASLRSPCLPGN